MQQKLTITKPDVGARLDVFLSRESGMTRSRIQGLIVAGNVLINGKIPVKAGVCLREEDIVAWEEPAPIPTRALAQDIPVDILYQDADVAVVNKPRGMVVHPAAGHADGTLVNALLHALDGLSGIGGELRPGIVHRLDADTTGLLVVAKNDAAHVHLAQQLSERTAGRIYLAVAQGAMKKDTGTIDAPIGRDSKDRKRMCVMREGRQARTHWEQLQPIKNACLLKMQLDTGRTHQIRVHLRSVGHPVVGDALYGYKNDATSLLMLHAWRLSFDHPTTGERMSFTAPAPDDFLAVLRARGGDLQAIALGEEPLEKAE